MMKNTKQNMRKNTRMWRRIAREHEKEDMGLKEGKALVLFYPTLSVWLQRALTKDSKAVHGDTGI